MTKSRLVVRTIRNIPTFVLDYLGLLRRDVEYVLRSGHTTVVARAGTADCREIVVVMSGYEYDLSLLPSLEHPVVFDVGAHIGSFTLYALDHFNTSEPRIVAFEPEEENFRYLKLNIMRNRISPSRCVLRNCAIGTYNGFATLDTSTRNDAYAIVSDPRGAFQECPVRTLEQVASDEGIRRIDVLKVDIEGGEHAVFADEETLRFIGGSVRFILVEHHVIDDWRDKRWLAARLEPNFSQFFERGDVMYFRNTRIV